MKNIVLDKTGQQLLLYLEIRQVEHKGRVPVQTLSREHRKLINEWAEDDFVTVEKIHPDDAIYRDEHCVALSPSAWVVARRFRRAIAKLNIENRTYRTLGDG
jgi:hypothetical protein